MSDQVKDLIIREVRRERGSRKRLLRYFECRCINEGCSNLTYRDVYSMKNWSGNCKPCSDIPKLTKAKLKPHPCNGRPYEALYNSVKKQCVEKNKEITLTYEEFVEFTDYKKCHYCLSEIKWAIRNLTLNGSRYNLDRKDNLQGYSKENCVPCCWRCNNGKGDRFSYEEWYGMTEYFRKK